jgi:hypothetical protein
MTDNHGGKLKGTNILNEPGREFDIQGKESKSTPTTSNQIRTERMALGVEKGYRTEKAIHAIGLTAFTFLSPVSTPLLLPGTLSIPGYSSRHGECKGIGEELRIPCPLFFKDIFRTFPKGFHRGGLRTILTTFSCSPGIPSRTHSRGNLLPGYRLIPHT